MPTAFRRIIGPVKRQGAERYLRLTLLSFAASVILTRTYLTLTGFPQLGSGTLHIAHLLWGGLLLFIAALLPLILANRWVYFTTGILSGVGVGLFIDEVGKFITRTNDYFYPAAAPIIYATFLLTVLLYLQISRQPSRDDRAELYRIFEDLGEVLDHDLDPRERASLEERLKAVVARGSHPDYVRLATDLLDFLNSPAVLLSSPAPGYLDRLATRSRAAEARVLTRVRFKAVLVIALIILGFLEASTAATSGLALYEVATTANLAGAESQVLAKEDPGAPAAVDSAEPRSANRPVHPGARTVRSRIAFWLRSGLEILVGILMILGAILLLWGRERRGVLLGIFGLLLALTTINLLVFYFDQFGAVAQALVQFLLLVALLRYRRRYLLVPARPAGLPTQVSPA
jgi:hypothetical protein